MFKMANSVRFVTSILVQSFVISVLINLSYADESDIYCLRSIKESLEDPFNHFKASWNFNNNNTPDFICSFIGVACWHANENRVLSIQLSNMGLKGHFPRGFVNCTYLVGLDLSSNELSGPIPLDISRSLEFVTSLDLSFNQFCDEIPSSIANLSYLNVLLLNNNQLTGHIPTQIGWLQRIKAFSVAHNFLSGPVPTFVHSKGFQADAYTKNPGLCGFPLDPCVKMPREFFISGFVVGWSLVTILVLVAVISFCMPKEDKKIMISFFNYINKAMTRKKNRWLWKKARIRGDQFWPTTKQRRNHIKMSTLEKLITRMSFTDLSEATDSFSQDNIIGLGKMGVMYKARLPNEWFLAVKRLQDSQLFEEQFTSELMTLGRLRHRNLAPLLGFCTESKERLLVYKYMSNGDLYNRLHSGEVETNIMMVWPLRVKVAIGVARGLAWLHHNHKFCIVHCNISSKCILLDAFFEPMISNFGYAKFLNQKDADADSSKRFYMDSEYWELGYVKKDVYGFGIVLLELLTGEEPSKVSRTSSSSNSFNGTSLVDWITHLSECSSSSLQIAIDKALIGQGFDDEIFQLLKVASDCIQPFSDRRPTMLQVYKTLSAIGERYGIADDTDVLMKQGNIA